jgi:hypothetical protein
VFIQLKTQYFLSVLLAISCVALGVLTIGQPQKFDVIAILALALTCFFSRKYINIVSVIILLIAGRLIEYIFFVISSMDLIFVLGSYLLCACCLYTFTRDKLRIIGLLALLLAISAQIYWYAISYPAPEIYWQIYIISFSFITRFLLFFRPAFTEFFTKTPTEHTPLDFKLYQVYGFPIVLECLNIIEYIIRNTTAYKPMFIYSTYPYIMQIIATFVLWLVIENSKKEWLKNTLKA